MVMMAEKSWYYRLQKSIVLLFVNIQISILLLGYYLMIKYLAI